MISYAANSSIALNLERSRHITVESIPATGNNASDCLALSPDRSRSNQAKWDLPLQVLRRLTPTGLTRYTAATVLYSGVLHTAALLIRCRAGDLTLLSPPMDGRKSETFRRSPGP